jgi:sialate O-acetylesterase
MQLKVFPLTGSGMVVQQGAAVPVRGRAAPGADVAVSFAGKTYRAKADPAGEWRLSLDSHAPGGPYTMEISSEGEKIAFNDIFVGDVWLCSGQSNMELPMARVKDDFPEEWAPPINGAIRQFKVPQEWDFSGPRRELSGGCWKAASAQALDEFSAAGWFFARALYEKRPTPIGLVNAAWGGTPVEAWMSREALAPNPAIVAEGDQYDNPAKCAEIARAHEAAIKEWEDDAAARDRGLAEGWQAPETDLAAWGDISLPDNFAGSAPANFCGVIWLRREFEASAEFAAGEARLWMGTIVDADTAYVNGVEVGNTPYRYPPCKYVIPAGLLRAGKNHIAIRVICRDGEGGVTKGKAFRVFSERGSVELGGAWKYRVGMSASPRPPEFFFQRQPMCLFNAMIAPILDYPYKGAIWYQGESNDPRPREYAALFAAMIDDWRKKNGRHFPFLWVQLPIFGEPEDNSEASSWAIIREAQAQALSLPATGMAAGLEFGEWNDLHPVNKKGIGRRLALAAEKTVFGERNTSPGPTVRGVERRGDCLVIAFDNCGEGLTTEKTSRGGTEDAEGAEGREGEEGKSVFVSVIAGGESFRVAGRIIGGDCVEVDLAGIGDRVPERVLYAWANNPRDRQLFNSEGLPALPFREKIS